MLEGHLAPVLIRVLGMRRMAKLAISQSLLSLDAKQALWLVEVMAAQDQSLMLTAWRETMSFDSRPRLGEIACPTLILAGSNDRGVPIHHAEMLHEGIAESRLVVIDGADHALLWTHTDEFLRTVDEFLDRR
jgi:pimeloyl-ACP methyl ester carboxylesterase